MPTAMPCEPLASRLGNAPGSTTGSSRCRHRSGGNRPRPRRCRRAAAARPRSCALRCSAWRRRYRRRCCRNCPARRSADSATRNPARAAPARRRSTGRRAGGYLPITSPTTCARLLERRAGIEPQQAHGVQQAPVHRLQPVARVRQRAVHDGRQRIGEIALFQRLAQRDVLDVGRFGRNQPFTHGGSVLRSRWMNKRRMNSPVIDAKSGAPAPLPFQRQPAIDRCKSLAQVALTLICTIDRTSANTPMTGERTLWSGPFAINTLLKAR